MFRQFERDKQGIPRNLADLAAGSAMQSTADRAERRRKPVIGAEWRCLRRFAGNRSGTSAVEFALVTPVFILLLFGTISFGYLFGIYSSVQQLASESARASVPGLSDTERAQLAQSYISANSGNYFLLDPTKLTVTTIPIGAPSPAFEVSLAYDLTSTFIWQFKNLVPINPSVQRSAVVLRGGY